MGKRGAVKILDGGKSERALKTERERERNGHVVIPELNSDLVRFISGPTSNHSLLIAPVCIPHPLIPPSFSATFVSPVPLSVLSLLFFFPLILPRGRQDKSDRLEVLAMGGRFGEGGMTQRRR